MTLALPRDAVSVPLARRVSSQLLRSLGFLAEDVADIELALTEACSNVLRHSSAESDYELRLNVLVDRVVIAVHDMGGGLPAGTLERGTADTAAEGGRGISLMRALVDELSFESVDPRGSVVRMERRLRTDPGSTLARLIDSVQDAPRAIDLAGGAPGSPAASPAGRAPAAPVAPAHDPA